jgi:hypothetical protein
VDACGQSSDSAESPPVPRLSYAASGTARARLTACSSRAIIVRSACSRTRSRPRVRSGVKPYSFLSLPNSFSTAFLVDLRRLYGVTLSAERPLKTRLERPLGASAHVEVEGGKKRAEKIRSPVLFGEVGTEDMAYEVNAFHAVDGIALEVEAGRGARGNAVYRDLIEGSLVMDAKYLALAAMQEYRHKSSGRGTPTVVRSYLDARSLLNAIYASNRLLLPFEGLLLIGY